MKAYYRLIIGIALAFVRSVVKNPTKAAGLDEILIDLRDELNVAYPIEDYPSRRFQAAPKFNKGVR